MTEPETFGEAMAKLQKAVDDMCRALIEAIKPAVQATTEALQRIALDSEAYKQYKREQQERERAQAVYGTSVVERMYTELKEVAQRYPLPGDLYWEWVPGEVWEHGAYLPPNVSYLASGLACDHQVDATRYLIHTADESDET